MSQQHRYISSIATYSKTPAPALGRPRRRLLVVLAAVAAAALTGPATANGEFGVVPAPPGSALPGPSSWWAGTCGLASPALDFAGPAPANPRDCVDRGAFSPGGNVQTTAPSWRLAARPRAGAHPDATATWTYRPNPDGGGTDGGGARDIVVDLPPGALGNPTAVTQCSQVSFAESPSQCPPSSQVGVTILRLYHGAFATTTDYVHPVYVLEPRPGYTAELGLPDIANEAMIRVYAKARTNGDFGVRTGGVSLPTALPLIQQTLTVWGVPWAAEHDHWRVPRGWAAGSTPGAGVIGIPPSGLDCSDDRDGAPQCPTPYDPSWGPVKPFFTNPTECDPVNAPSTRLFTDSYLDPALFVDPDVLGGSAPIGKDPLPGDESWSIYDSEAPHVVGCAAPPFAPSIDFEPTSRSAGGASGLSVRLSVPQNDVARAGDGGVLERPAPGAPQNVVDDYVAGATDYFSSAEGAATAHLDRAVVKLPPGLSVNPSAATGLQACSNGQMGVTDASSNPMLFNDGDPFNDDGGADGAECPDASRIGTVEVDTPLLDETLTGDVVLGSPHSTDPRSGEMFRLFLVLRSKERDLVAKVFGVSRASGQPGEGGTGQLEAVFDKNPRVPVNEMRLEFKRGERGLLALPQDCGSGYAWDATFTPWTAAHAQAGQPASSPGSFAVDQACAPRFAPGLRAGMDTRTARANGRFAFKFARQDQDRWFDRLTADLPEGLLASVKGVPLCTDAQANAGACPLGSQIGIVDAKAGSGDPFVLEQKGRVYLTEGYKGGEYGLMVKVRAIAGPFRGATELSPIIVRQAIHVDRRTAQVTAISDPFPQVWHGVPLRVREVLVKIDRPNFMLNPSDCSPKQVQATILSAEGTRADVANHFQASDCADLRFKPRLKLALKGRRQVRTGKHPAIRAVVRQQGIPEAGIAKAEVRLPKSLALDVNNAQELCEFEDGTKPDLENHCPKGSIVGRARAKTPLLNDDLVGNVYFVKNVRIDKDTGNEIRTLPMIVVALRGEIAVNLVGESDTTRSGKLVNTFDNVPDAPITRFNLNIAGGKNGILAVTRTRRSRINLCAKPGSHIAEADMDGQNGKRHDDNIRMKTPCRKRRHSAAKVCRKRTESKKAFRRCVTKVKRNRAQAKRRAAKKKAAAKRSDGGGRR